LGRRKDGPILLEIVGGAVRFGIFQDPRDPHPLPFARKISCSGTAKPLIWLRRATYLE
jgi:hypothetical protein